MIGNFLLLIFAHPRGMSYMTRNGNIIEVNFERDLNSLSSDQIHLMLSQIKGKTRMDEEAVEILKAQQQKHIDRSVEQLSKQLEDAGQSQNLPHEYSAEVQMKIVQDQLDFNEDWRRRLG
jgi:hypothetical protein